MKWKQITIQMMNKTIGLAAPPSVADSHICLAKTITENDTCPHVKPQSVEDRLCLLHDSPSKCLCFSTLEFMVVQ